MVEDQLRLARKVSKYLKEKYFPLYNLMFVISGHPHIRQLTVWTDLPPPSFLRLKIMSENAFRNNIFLRISHFATFFSYIFSVCDFCNKYHVFDKNY